ncbi:MAG: helix-turn-helix domain-containing protein [Acidobacteriota bacterium]|nr:helix-turn-helix domain-containing protein [Acidobacteriota bacterium]
MVDARTALFVRIPVAQAKRLDAHARTLGRTKQDFVSDLLAASLGSTPTGADGDQNAVQPDEVVTLGELAEMLKLDELAVLERVLAGDLPGRRFGDQWRFSRHAVLGWLDGCDVARPGPGFKTVR